MKDVLEGATFLGVPTVIAAAIVGLYFIIDLKTKIVPEVVSIKKYFEKRKERKAAKLLEQKQQKKMLEDMQGALTDLKQSVNQSLKDVKTSVDASINEMKSHYTPEKIAQRDAWMQWVNERAGIYDDSVEKLLLLQDKLNENNEITLGLYINSSRNRILDFARVVADDNALVSQEEFARIYKINKEYHDILAKYNRENGEVDTAMKIIKEAYDYRIKHRSFIEDVRGYTRK